MKYLLIISALFVFASCDPAMNLHLKVQNNSSEKLILEFKGLHNYNQDTTVILNITEEVTFLNTSLREKAKHYDCCPCEVGELNIFTVDTTATLIKGYKNKDNWIKINESNNNVYCLFEMSDEDLQ